MDNQKIEQLLEQSVLPTLLQMVKATSSLSQQQAKTHEQVLLALKQMTPVSQSDVNVCDTIKLLVDKIGDLVTPISSLIHSTNELIDLQKEQMTALEQLQASYDENNARLNLLTLVVKEQIGDKPLDSMYQTLQTGHMNKD